MAGNDAQVAQVALGPEYTHKFSVKSEKDPALTGDITVSLPNGRDLMKIAVVQYQLREGVPFEALDGFSQSAVIILSELSVVVREAPPWWYRTVGTGKDAVKVPAPEELRDWDLINDIWGRYSKWRNTFPGRRDDQAAGGKTGGTEAVAPGATPGPLQSV